MAQHCAAKIPHAFERAQYNPLPSASNGATRIRSVSEGSHALPHRESIFQSGEGRRSTVPPTLLQHYGYAQLPGLAPVARRQPKLIQTRRVKPCGEEWGGRVKLALYIDPEWVVTSTTSEKKIRDLLVTNGSAEDLHTAGRRPEQLGTVRIVLGLGLIAEIQKPRPRAGVRYPLRTY